MHFPVKRPENIRKMIFKSKQTATKFLVIFFVGRELRETLQLRF